MPVGSIWHAFTEGSCGSNLSPDEALASWSVIKANRGTECRPLEGTASAAFSAISWAAMYPGDLHLWVDNQTVVDCLRALIQNTGTQTFGNM